MPILEPIIGSFFITSGAGQANYSETAAPIGPKIFVDTLPVALINVAKKNPANPDPNPDFSGKIRIPETVCRIELKFSGWILVDIHTYLIHQRTEFGGPVAGKPVPKAAGSHTFDN